jgi:Pectate lyase superfamily protein
MAIQSLIAFAQVGQGPYVAGQAAVGVDGSLVTVSNAINVGVTRWDFTVVDAPPASAITPGLKQSGGSPTWTFTPDVPDEFVIQLDVYDALTNKATDVRVFAVNRAGGRRIPGFKATAGSNNFAGQTRGWAPEMERWVGHLDAVHWTDLSTLRPDSTRVHQPLDGYSAAGDGGEGIVFWNAADTRASNGYDVQAVTGIATGRWNRLHDPGFYNVRWFGAKGDGVTDDTAAIQAAINVFVGRMASVAGELLFPAGTYIITSTIVGTFSGGTSVRMRGARSGFEQSTVIYWKGNAALQTMFDFHGVVSWEFQDLILNANYGNSWPTPAAVGMWFHTDQPGGGSASYQNFIKDCGFYNFEGAGGYADSAGIVLGDRGVTTDVSAFWFDNVTVQGNVNNFPAHVPFACVMCLQEATGNAETFHFSACEFAFAQFGFFCFNMNNCLSFQRGCQISSCLQAAYWVGGSSQIYLQGAQSENGDVTPGYFSPTPMTHVTGAGPDVSLTGTPAVGYQQFIIIVTTGATLASGNMRFKWSKDNGANFTLNVVGAASVALGGTGLTAHFGAGTYAAAGGGPADEYTAFSLMGVTGHTGTGMFLYAAATCTVHMDGCEIVQDCTAQSGLKMPAAYVAQGVPQWSNLKNGTIMVVQGPSVIEHNTIDATGGIGSGAEASIQTTDVGGPTILRNNIMRISAATPQVQVYDESGNLLTGLAGTGLNTPNAGRPISLYGNVSTGLGILPDLDGRPATMGSIGLTAYTIADANMVVPYWNQPRVVTTCFQIDFNDATLAAGGTGMYLALIYQRMIILRVFVEVVTPFTGGGMASLTMELGNNGDRHRYMLPVDILTAPANYGMNDADLGAGLARATAVQGGDPSLWGTSDFLFATFAPTGDTTNHLTAGRLKIYVTAEQVTFP